MYLYGIEMRNLLRHVIGVATALIVPLWNWNLYIFRASAWALMALIVPLWNWNKGQSRYVLISSKALIVPLWNWNCSDSAPNERSPCFNCTFMELKFGRNDKSRYKLSGFNCTFMELKFITEDIPLKKGVKALIVPLWNWKYI